MGTGDRGWRPGGLTPGYCLKPFQGFEDGLGKVRGSAELMTGVGRAREVWRRDVSIPEALEGLGIGAGTGWDVSSQRVLVSKAWVVWRRDVSNPEVIAGRDRLGRLVSERVLGCEGWAVATRRRLPEGVDLAADGADGTDKKERESVAARIVVSPSQRLCPPCTASPSSAKSAKSAVPSLAGHAQGVLLGSARRTSAFRLRGGERGPAEHAEGRRTGQAGLGLGPHRVRSPGGGPLDELSFAAAVSRSIAIHRD